MSFIKEVKLQEAKFIIKTLRLMHSKLLKYIRNNDHDLNDEDDNAVLVLANELSDVIFKFVILMRKKFGNRIHLPA